MATKRVTTVYSMMSQSDSDCLIITHFRGGVKSDDDYIIVSSWNKKN